MENLMWSNLWESLGLNGSSSTFSSSIEGGKIDLLKWVEESCCSMNQWMGWSGAAENQCHWNTWTGAAAAADDENGHVDLQNWARANARPWNEIACKRPADGGHVEILKWARVMQSTMQGVFWKPRRQYDHLPQRNVGYIALAIGIWSWINSENYSHGITIASTCNPY